MRLNFIQRYLMPGIDPVSGGIAAVQAGMGIVQAITGAAKTKKLLAQRKAYTTPEEYYDILHATQSMASQGYDAFTLNYLTNQTDRAFSSTLGAATRLGADPNDLSAILDQKLQGIMKIGADNHQLNMENFSKYLSAVDVIGQNKAAEWSSQQDILKDKLQAAAADKAAGLQNLGSAANAFIGLRSAEKTSSLYKDQNDKFKDLLDILKAGGFNLPASTGGGGGRTPSEILANQNRPV